MATRTNGTPNEPNLSQHQRLRSHVSSSGGSHAMWHEKQVAAGCLAAVTIHAVIAWTRQLWSDTAWG